MRSPAIQKPSSAIAALTVCFILIAWTAIAQQDKPGRTALGVQLSREAQMQGVQVPIYGMDSRLEARLRMQTVSVVARKVGFFGWVYSRK